MERLVQILDCPEIGCPQVLKFVLHEMCRAFTEEHGCIVREVHRWTEIKDAGMVFMGDTFRDRSCISALAAQNPNAIFIGWYWHDVKDIPFRRFLHTGENSTRRPTVGDAARFDFLTTHPLFVPLLLRANEDPKLIGRYPRTNVDLVYCYMGWPYHTDWVPAHLNGVYHGVKEHKYFWPYDRRRSTYLRSQFSLGFQCDLNLDAGHVSQRIFEGLAYGAVVLSESKFAVDLTDSAVVYIADGRDLCEKMTYFQTRPDAYKEQQERGYDWCRKYGTNRASIKLFLDKIAAVFNLGFTKPRQTCVVQQWMFDFWPEAM